MAYRILIVDDSTVTREVLKKTIGMTGLPVEKIYEARDGREGLNVLRENPIDIILADLNMPRMNGMEMIEKILADSSAPLTPIVVISTESSVARIERLQEIGVKNFIHKPFTPESVRNALKEVVRIKSVL